MSSRPAKPMTPAEVISLRRNRLAVREGYISLLGRVVFIAAAAWLLFSQVFLLMQARGTDMFPAVKDGDLLIGYRLQKDYEQENVVVYKRDGKSYVGRVVAKSGDYVDITEEGSLIVNGTVKSGEILYPTYEREGVNYPYVVPESMVFILADYRTQAQDSRDFGAVELKYVQAKVITNLSR